MEILMERTVLNPHADPAQWVAGYAGTMTTPEDVFVLQVKRASKTQILCALWVHTTHGMESIATWWGDVGSVEREVSALMQREVVITWQS